MELAAQGWTTPLWVVPSEMSELLGSGVPDEVDGRFVEFYERDGGVKRSETMTWLLNRESLAPWRVLLSQVSTAYDRDDFAIAVPSLLAVLEGVLMADEGTSVRVRDAASRRVEQSSNAVRKWLWGAVSSFVDEVYRRSDFGGQRPSVINRHWILHGRDSSTWTQADCLRLIQAIEVVTSLFALDDPVERAPRAGAVG